MRRAITATCIFLAATAGAQQAPKPIPIRIETSLGTIDAELDSVRAPITVTNFLLYVDGRRYENGRFFRTVTLSNQPNDSVKIEVIQGGMGPEKRGQGFQPILLERTSVTGLRHLDGTLSVARSGPDSGTDQFFITIGPQPDLDFGGKRNRDGQGFAAFGRVTSGMDIVRKIQAGVANGQNLVTPVTILRIIRR